jgi:hypothetical protein
MENQSPAQNLNEEPNTNTPMPVPLQVMIQNYQTMLNTINSPANQSGVVQANVVNRVGTLYKLILEYLLPIINGLLDFMKAFISKIGEQDRKIYIQQENLNIQAQNLRVIGDLIDAVKNDLKNTKIQFDSSMKAYHKNLDKITSEYHKNIDDLANKLIQDKGQEIKPISKDALSMFAGNKTKKHRKHRRKISK